MTGLKRLTCWFFLYVAIFVGFAIVRWRLWTYGADTGLFAQVVSNAFAGFVDGPERGTHFRYHWSPILAALWPLVALTRTPLVLQIVQLLLLGATAFPLYALARSYVAELNAYRYAVIALLYPPLLAVAFGEFHEIAFFPVLALALVWAADRARWLWFAACGFLSAMIREDVSITLIIVGLAFAAIGWVRRNRTTDAGLLAGEPCEPARLIAAGLGLSLLNATVVAFYFLVVVPRVGGWHPSRFYDYPFANGPLAVLAAMVTHPSDLLRMLNLGRFTYLLEAFAPLAFLPLLSRWTLLAVPGFAILLLSSDSIAWRMGSHYAALWMPWLLLGALAVLIGFERARSANAAMRWRTGALAVSLLVLVAFDPLHPLHYFRAWVPQRGASMALAVVPRSAAIATHDEWYTPIALEYPNATNVPCPGVTYAVYDFDFPNLHLADVRDAIAAGQARVIYASGVIAVARGAFDARAKPADCY
jgi:uncharacterized membrane protein